MPRARIAAEQALTLDKSLAEAHASMTLVKSVLQWGRAKAEDEFQHALALNPNYGDRQARRKTLAYNSRNRVSLNHCCCPQRQAGTMLGVASSNLSWSITQDLNWAMPNVGGR